MSQNLPLVTNKQRGPGMGFFGLQRVWHFPGGRRVASGNLLVLLTIGSTECAERTFFIRISIQMVLVNAG